MEKGAKREGWRRRAARSAGSKYRPDLAGTLVIKDSVCPKELGSLVGQVREDQPDTGPATAAELGPQLGQKLQRRRQWHQSLAAVAAGARAKASVSSRTAEAKAVVFGKHGNRSTSKSISPWQQWQQEREEKQSLSPITCAAVESIPVT